MENGKSSSPQKMNKKFIIIAVVAVVVVGAIVALMMMNQGAKTGNTNTNTNTNANTPKSGEEVAPAPDMEGEAEMAAEEIAVQEMIKESVALVPGGDLVTKDNKVITPEGVVTENSAPLASPTAPKQTPVVDVATLPDTVIKLSVSAAGFVPNSFEVKPGAPVSLSITTDHQTHIFKFNDARLGGIAVAVDPNTTRAITFNAPTEKGEYSFYCDLPRHADRGEVGNMIVK